MSTAPSIIVVSGKIASGKTTFAHALANHLGVDCIGFGDEVRSIAESRGLPLTREMLQSVGEEQVRDRPRAFCEAVLRRANYQPGQGLVLEGLRHAEILALLRELLSPVKLVHVHILSSEEERQQRIATRARPGDVAVRETEEHSTEAQLMRTLPTLADVTVDGSRPVADIVSEAAKSISLF